MIRCQMPCMLASYLMKLMLFVCVRVTLGAFSEEIEPGVKVVLCRTADGHPFMNIFFLSLKFIQSIRVSANSDIYFEFFDWHVDFEISDGY